MKREVKETLELLRKKNEKFTMNPQKATRLKKRMRKIIWTDEQFKEFEQTRKKHFKWN